MSMIEGDGCSHRLWCSGRSALTSPRSPRRPWLQLTCKSFSLTLRTSNCSWIREIAPSPSCSTMNAWTSSENIPSVITKYHRKRMVAHLLSLDGLPSSSSEVVLHSVPLLLPTDHGLIDLVEEPLEMERGIDLGI